MKCHRADTFITSLWDQVATQCCSGDTDEEPNDLHDYYSMCHDGYLRVARACRMGRHILQRAGFRWHAQAVSKISSLAERKMRLADQYRRQAASLASFGDNAIHHIDWHLDRMSELNVKRDDLISEQVLLEAEIWALLQVNQYEYDQAVQEEEIRKAETATH